MASLVSIFRRITGHEQRERDLTLPDDGSVERAQATARFISALNDNIPTSVPRRGGHDND